MSAIKINGTWQRVSSIKIKQNGVWNDHTALYARLDGAWHLIDLAAEAQGPAYHVWKAYADDALGSGISLSPEGKKYIGFAVGQRTEEPDLSDPSLYDWSLIKGADGKDGQDVDPEVLNEILEKQNSYNSSLSDVNDDLAAVDQALADADSRLKAADVALSKALQTTQVDFASSVDALNESLGELDESVSTRLGGLDESVSTRLDGLDESLSKQIQDLDSSTSGHVSRIDAKLNGVDSSLASITTSMNSEFDRVDSSVAAATGRIGEVESDLLNLTSLSGEQGSSITLLENATDEQAQKISVLETNDGNTRSRVGTLESTSEEQATRLASLGVWDGEAFATIKTLEEADAENASLIRTLETRGEEADSKIATLESTSSSHASRLSTVETRSTDAQNRAAALEETTQTHAIRLTNVETQANDTESKVSTLEETSEGHATRLTSVETKATNANDRSITNSNRVVTLEETSTEHASRLTSVETVTLEQLAKSKLQSRLTPKFNWPASSSAENALKYKLFCDYEGKALLRAELYDPEWDTQITFNGVPLSPKPSGPNNAIRWYEYMVDAVKGDNEFAIWANGADGGQVITLELRGGDIGSSVKTLEETSEGHATRLTNVETKATTGVNKANAAQAAADTANESVSEVTNRVSTLEETSEGHASRLTNVETKATTGVNKANAALASADAANETVNEVTNRVSTLEETSEGHASRLTNVETKATTGVNKANAAQAAADTANESVSEVTNRVSTLEETSEGHASRLTYVETKATTGVNKANAAQSSADEANEAVSEVTNRVSTLEETSEGHASRLTSVETKATSAVSKANTNSNRVSSLESTSSDHASRLTSLESVNLEQLAGAKVQSSLTPNVSWPANATIDEAVTFSLSCSYAGKAALRVKLDDAEWETQIAFNGKQLNPRPTGPDKAVRWYEYLVDTLEGDNEVAVWATSSDGGRVIAIELRGGDIGSSVKTLESTSAGHASRLTNVETKTTTAISKADAAQSTANSGVSKANAAQSTADSANTKVTAVTNRVSTLEETSEGHASRLTNVETKATTGVNKANAAQAAADEANESVSEVTNRVSTLEETSEGHASRLTNVETKATTGVNKANAAQASADAANSGVSEVTNRVSTLEETSEGHASRLTNVETKATTGVNKANAAQSSADEANEAVSEVTNRVSTLEETSEGHASRLTNVETKATSAVTKAEGAQSTANSGVTKANAAQSSANSANTKVTAVTNRVTTLEETSEGHASRLTNVETKATTAVSKADAAQDSADSANTKVNSVTNRVGTLESTSSSHASRLTNVETKASNAESKANTNSNRVSTLESTSSSHATRLTNVESVNLEQLSGSRIQSALSPNIGWTGNSSYDGANKFTLACGYAGKAALRLQLWDAEGGLRVAFNGTEVSPRPKGSNEQTKWFEYLVDAKQGDNEVAFWSSADGGKILKIELRGGDLGSSVKTLESTSTGHASRLTNVETKATTAVSKADAAQNTANSATTKANNAQDTADQANEKVDSVTNRVSTLEETSEGHASRLSTVETTASSGVSKANAAQSTANSATTKANNAQNTANSGVSKANAAQAKADSAYSKVTSVTSRVSTFESTTETMATKVDEVSFSRANLVTRGVFGSNLSRGSWTAGSVVSTQAVGIPTLSGRPYVLKLTSRDCYDYNAKFPISVGDKVYISAWVYTTDTNVSLNIGFRQLLDGVEQSSWPTIIREADRSGKWVYVEGTYTHTSSSYNGLAPFLQMGGSGTMPPAYISDIVYSRSSHSGALAAVTDESKAYVDQQTGELKAERVIKADANGKVSGIHLLAKGSGADAGGKLYFQADEIAIVPPSWNPSTEADKTKFPFYFSEDRSFMYLDEAMIQKLSAETIDSGRLAVDGLTVLSDDISMPAGSIRDHMIDPAFKDGIVRVNPDASIQGGTKSVSSTGIGQGKKITVPALESGGSAQTMTISVVGPNEVNRKDVQFDLEMKLNGAPYNFTSGESKIRLSSKISYSTEDGGIRMYRSSFKFEDQVILPAPTKGNEYTYEFIITNMSFSPSNTSTYNFADKLKFSISVSEPTVSSGGFITDVRWDEVKEQPSFVALDTAGSSSYPRMFAGNNPASSNIWLRMPATNGGLLPYSNGNSLLGTSSWKFKEIHSVNFYENGTVLSSKYLGKTATATNSNKLDGYSLTAASTGDTVARRDSAADLSARLFRSSYGNQSDISGAIAFRKSTSDNYIRFCSNMAAVRAFVDVYAKGEVYSKGESDSKHLGKGDTAAAAKLVEYASTVEYGHSGLQAANVSGNGGDGKDGNTLANPTNDWWYHIVTNHANSGGYYFDIACSFHHNRLMFKRVANGTHTGFFEIFHTGKMGSGSGLDADKLDGRDSSGFVKLGTTSENPNTYAYLYRSHSSAPALYAVNAGSGDLARFLAGSKGSTDATRGVRFANDGSVESSGQIVSTGAALGTNQVAAIFRHPTQNVNLALVGKNAATGAFRFEANTDGDLRIQTANTGGAYSASNGDAGTLARFYRNGNVEVTGQLKARGGLYHASGAMLVMGGTNTWYRAYGEDGLFFQDHGGGFRMTDNTWIRTYGGKQFYVDNGSSFDAIYTAGGIRYNKQLFSAHPTGEGGLVGNYDVLGASSQQMIWTIGKSWSSHSNHYGLGYAYGNYLGTGRSEHFLYLKNNGVAGVRLGLEGNAKFEGEIRAADLIATSDRRVKDNIKVIPDALEKVSKLTGNTYTRNDLDGKPSAGVIAQEVQEVLPEAVTETEGRLQVAHNGVIGLLVEAVKELKAIVTMQEIKIKQLKGGH